MRFTLAVLALGLISAQTVKRELPKRQPFVYGADGMPKCQDAECRYWRAQAAEAQWMLEGSYPNIYPVWQTGWRFEDIKAYDATHELTGEELTKLIYALPNIKTVKVQVPGRGEVRKFDIQTLAYPQYAKDYMLTQEEWRGLQSFCRLQLDLTGPNGANSEVIEHWQKIVKGEVPFGLRVNR